MRYSRFERCLPHLILCIVVGSALIAGCDSPVGDPCLPEKIPESKDENGNVIKVGFSEKEAYIETSSVQCETRVCLVYRLEGDPSPNCDPTISDCPTAKEISDRVYCSCRCKTDDPDFATCECPDDFVCHEVQESGDPGSRGSYCIRSDTLKR